MKRHRRLKWVAGSKTPPKTYITRVFNFGTWEEWQDMRRRFSKRDIEDAVKNPLKGQWTRHGKAFAEILFDHHLPDKALISYNA